MTKNLIIGAFTDYKWPQIAPWVHSINQCGFRGDKVAIVFNASFETVGQLIRHDVKPVIFGRDDQKKTVFYHSDCFVHIERFYIIYKFLLQSAVSYDYVVTTDVRDVVFQSDPVQWLRDNLGDKQLVAAGESIRYGDEEWNRLNLLETYGPQLYDIFKDNEVYNVGTLGGTGAAMRDLALNIYSASVNRRIPIVDQATFNVLIQSPPIKDIVKFARGADGWACQAGVNAAPDKIETFRPFLTEPGPVFENGVVKTADGKIFPIVHQYDRVPEWKEFFHKKFGDKNA